MSIIKNLALFCIALFVLQACDKKNDSSHTIKEIKLNPAQSRSIKFSEVFSSVEVVKLSDESLLGEIKKVIYSNQNIYLVCSNGIHIFDYQGNFKSKIDKLGEAPGEYKSLTDVFVSNDKIEVLDRKGRRIIYFNLDGTYESEWNIETFADSFHKINDDLYAFYKGNNRQKEKDFLFLIKSKSKNNKVYEDLEMKMNQTGYIQFSDLTNFSEYKGKPTFSYSSSNTIYEVGEDKLTPRYKLDFGKHNITDDFLNRDYEDVSYFMTAFLKSDYAFLIDAFHESDKTIFFSFDLAANKKHVFLSKNNGEAIIANKMIDDLDNIFSYDTDYENTPKTIVDDKLCYLIDPLTLKEKLFLFKQKEPNSKWEALLKKYPMMEKIISNAKPAVNPVILLAKMK